MTVNRMKELGLVVKTTGPSLEAELEFSSSPLLNPLSLEVIDRVQVTLIGDRLMILGPPALVGLPPISLLGISGRPHLEQELTSAFEAHVLHLKRRSAELQALGIPAQVDSDTLELSAHVEQPPFTFVLLADKQGQFRLAGIFQDGKEVAVPTSQPFDLSEFRERDALAGYLAALVPQAAPSQPPERRAAGPGEVHFSEVAQRFGAQAQLPPRSTLEVLVELRVGKTRYRFAAARLVGRSFRGLLAGPSGKMWAERFELEDFPGPAALLAQTLGISVESVEIVPPYAGER
jgi:hypothetical protein